MKEVVFVGIGGFVGSVCRYGIGLLSKNLLPGPFPSGTLIVNLLGSLLIGVLASYFLRSTHYQGFYLILVTGFCGGFTTFSTFSHDNLQLVRLELYWPLVVYGFVSILGGLFLCLLGFVIAEKFLK